jgi:signal peptidase II
MFLLTKKMIAAYLAVIFFVGLDRFLKSLALASQEQQANLLGQVLRFGFKANYYIAFSLPLAGRLLVITIGLIVVVLIFLAIYCYQRRADAKLLPLSLIILGAGSNLFDRARFGYVIDYLDLRYFTIFNLADALIVVGVVLLIILYKR